MKEEYIVIRRWDTLSDDLYLKKNIKELKKFLACNGTNYEIYKINCSEKIEAEIILKMN